MLHFSTYKEMEMSQTDLRHLQQIYYANPLVSKNFFRCENYYTTEFTERIKIEIFDFP